MRATIVLITLTLALVACFEKTQTKDAAPQTGVEMKVLLRDNREANRRKCRKGDKKCKKLRRKKARKAVKKGCRKGDKGCKSKKKNRRKMIQKKTNNKKKKSKTLKKNNKRKARKNKINKNKKKTKSLKKHSQKRSKNTKQPSNISYCDGTDVYNAFKNYRKTRNFLQKANRMISFIQQIERKAASSTTSFTNATKALEMATDNGTKCNDPSATEEAIANLDKLRSCPSTAADSCDSSPANINVTEAQLTACLTTLGLLKNASEICLKNVSRANSSSSAATSCSCLTTDAIPGEEGTAPGIFPMVGTSVATCYTVITGGEAKVKEAKKNCTTKSGPDGSFFDCMSTAKESILLVAECLAPISMTTSAPSTARLLKIKNLFKKF